MKAAWYERNGPAHDVLVHGDMEQAEPKAGEVRVCIHASGINPSDTNGRKSRPPVGPRVVPHSDGAGVIDVLGEGATRHEIGQRVWVWNAQWKRPFGTAAEYICVPEDQVATLPEGVSFAAGACLGIPTFTAMHALRYFGNVAGKTLLVTGAGSSVGHYATQMATLAGARVIGTASGARSDLARAAGAECVIDYRSQDVSRAILDATAGEGVYGIIDIDFSTTVRLLADNVLKPRGSVVCYGSNAVGDASLSFMTLLMNSYTLKFFAVYELSIEDRAAVVSDLSRMLAGNVLTHNVGQRFPLAQIACAHEAVESGGVAGNVVLEID